MKRGFALLGAVVVVGLAAFVAVTKANPPTGVTANLVGRGTYDAFNIRSDPHGAIADFRAHSTDPVDIVVQTHTFAPGSNTGWHQHPGPIFITVTKGQLTYYEADDPTCTPHVISAGQGFVDTGDGHLVRNETSQPAQDISVITAPVGGAFRTELPAPNPNCGF